MQRLELVLLMALGAGLGCVRPLPVEGAPCPCPPWLTCCRSLAQCLPPDAVCPRPDASSFPDAPPGTDGVSSDQSPSRDFSAVERDQPEGPLTGVDPPEACRLLGIDDHVGVETKFIPVRCGGGPGQPCHATTFPPTGLGDPGRIRSKLLDKRSALCPNDLYIDTANRQRSFILEKINPRGTQRFKEAICPSGSVGGGARMPYEGPPMPAAPLSPHELECFTWYVNTVTR